MRSVVNDETEKNASDKKNNSKPETRWDQTDAGTDAKGRELGISALPGETYFDYRRRLWAAINERSRQSA